MINLQWKHRIARFLLLVFFLAAIALGMLAAFAGMFFLIGGTDMVLRVWEGNVAAEGYKLYCVIAIIVGVLVGVNFGEWLWLVVLRQTSFFTENELVDILKSIKG